MKKTMICLIFIAAILLGSLTFAFQNLGKINRISDNSKPKEIESAVPVTVAPVILRDFEQKISAVGTLKARETVVLSPKVAGSVEEVLVDIGQAVVKGQALVRINSDHFDIAVQQATAASAAAKAMVSQAKVQLAHSQKQYLRASRLMADKAIPQARFEEAEAAFKAAKEQLLAVQGESNRALSAIRTAEKYQADALIRSPMSGVVVDRNVETGQAVAPGVPLLRILDQSLLQVNIQLPEKDFDKISLGMDTVIVVDAFKNNRFLGKVAIVNPMIDMQTRTFRARVEVDNPDGRLVEGMFARVELSVGKRRSLAVPRDALICLPETSAYHVFVIENGHAVKRNVVTGIISESHAEILQYLKAGDRVVTGHTGRLRSGVAVTVK